MSHFLLLEKICKMILCKEQKIPCMGSSARKQKIFTNRPLLRFLQYYNPLPIPPLMNCLLHSHEFMKTIPSKSIESKDKGVF